MEISRRTVDMLVALVVVLVGLAVMIDSYPLGIGWVNDSPGSGYFPFRVGAILSLASAAIAAQAAFGRSPEAREPFVVWARFKPVLAVLVPTGLYVLATNILGIYVASALFIGGFMRIGGRYGWLRTIVVSGATAVVLFWLFEVQFLVPLPKGPLESLLGY